jgi:hypothetical protein
MIGLAMEVNGQVLPVENLRLKLTPVYPISIKVSQMDSISSPLDLLSPTDSVLLTVSFDIDTTVSISKFHVTLGIDSISNTITDQYLMFDVTNPFPGIVYRRNLDNVEIDVGAYPFSDYYAGVRIITINSDTSGFENYQFTH